MPAAPIIEFDATFTTDQAHAVAASLRGARALLSGKAAAVPVGPPIITFGTTSAYTLMYNDQGSGASMDGAFYRPTAPSGFYILGDYAQGNYQPPALPSLTIKVSNDDPTQPVLAAPISYAQIWNDRYSGANLDGSVWMPTPPPGYVALGAVSQAGYNSPDVSQLRCIRSDLVKLGTIGALIWNDQGSGASEDVEIFGVVGLSMFYAQGNYNPPTGPVWFPSALG